MTGAYSTGIRRLATCHITKQFGISAIYLCRELNFAIRCRFCQFSFYLINSQVICTGGRSFFQGTHGGKQVTAW